MGAAGLVVGTHAVIQADVVFARLGLAVVDEQHRFGVAQRLALRAKLDEQALEPHLLMMSATPIPRTLAMSYFADLDVSTIDQLPPGRTPIVTKVFADGKHYYYNYVTRASSYDTPPPGSKIYTGTTPDAFYIQEGINSLNDMHTSNRKPGPPGAVRQCRAHRSRRGGGGGGYVEAIFAVTPYASYTYAIGSGGGGSTSGATGTTGGTSTFTAGATTYSATGGSGGRFSSGSGPAGGAGGSGSGAGAFVALGATGDTVGSSAALSFASGGISLLGTKGGDAGQTTGFAGDAGKILLELYK